MSAGIYNMTLEQGATKSITVTYKDSEGVAINLTGYSGRGSIKAKATDSTIIASFTVEIPNPTLGQVEITLSATALDSLALTGKSYMDAFTAYYDIEIYSGQTVIRLLNGAAIISPSITK